MRRKDLGVVTKIAELKLGMCVTDRDYPFRGVGRVAILKKTRVVVNFSGELTTYDAAHCQFLRAALKRGVPRPLGIHRAPRAKPGQRAQNAARSTSVGALNVEDGGQVAQKYFEVRFTREPEKFVRMEFATDEQTLRQHSRYERKSKNPASGVRWVSEMKQAKKPRTAPGAHAL